IVDRDGNVVLDYLRGTYGDFSTQWFPDSSAILLYSLDDEPLQVSLDGNRTTLSFKVLTIRAISPNNRAAFFGRRFRSDRLATLFTLDITTRQLYDHCQDGFNIITGNWSADGRYLPYLMWNEENVVRILDIVNNTYVSIMPYPVESSSDARRYIQLLGWSYVGEE
ncbi:MAG: hypothetical protein D6712_14890, partial [Chloroflexi bacterium]